MYRNLFDKHKERKAFISDDYKTLLVNFEFSCTAIPFNRENFIEKEDDFLDGKIYLSLKKNKLLCLEIILNKENLNLLYKTVIILAYIVGKNIHLQYFYKNFPYYPTDKYFNINGHCPNNGYILKKFFNNPTKTILQFFKILENKDSIINKLIYPLLKLNALCCVDIIFVSEYGLLEQLAKSHKISGKLFDTDSNEYLLLENFSKETSELLKTKYPEIHNVICNKFNPSNLNIRTNTKEKIKIFLENYKDGLFSDYKEQVDEWNKMRQTVHGSTKIPFMDEKGTILSRKLHELLLRILNEEVSDNFKNE